MTASYSRAGQTAPPERIASIDSCRVIAIFAVICVHTNPFMPQLFPDQAYRLPEYLFSQPTRFAVPFFFMVAGYFLGKTTLAGPERWRKVARYEYRLLMLLVVWSLLYILIPSFWPDLRHEGYMQVTANKINRLLDSPFRTIFEGGRVHLWFLASLIQGVALLALCTAGNRTSPAVALSVLLFAAGLLGGSYFETPLGLHFPFYTRNGPFSSTTCLTIGYLIYRKKPAITARQGLIIMAAGLGLHIGETWFLWRYFGRHWMTHDYLIGTVLTATGLLLFALARPGFGRQGNLHTLGKYTLGVYLCHLMIVDVLGPFTRLFELHIWQLLLPLLTYLFSVGLTAMLARRPWLKALVV